MYIYKYIYIYTQYIPVKILRNLRRDGGRCCSRTNGAKIAQHSLPSEPEKCMLDILPRGQPCVKRVYPNDVYSPPLSLSHPPALVTLWRISNIFFFRNCFSLLVAEVKIFVLSRSVNNQFRTYPVKQNIFSVFCNLSNFLSLERLGITKSV